MIGRILPTQAHACHYIPQLDARTDHLVLESLEDRAIDALLSSGFRHFGAYVFRPACESCSRCIPVRVNLDRYSVTRSARRLANRNQDLDAVVHRASPDLESYRLYKRHKTRFDSSEPASSDSFESYANSFYSPYGARWAISLRGQGRLLSRIHLDITERAASAIYCYYDDSKPERSLGTFSINLAIDLAKRRGCRHLYLGYFIRENHSMRYKIRFHPIEVLDHGRWISVANSSVDIDPVLTRSEGPWSRHRP